MQKETNIMSNSLRAGYEAMGEVASENYDLDTKLEDKTLRWSRRLSYVPRWCIVPTLQKQSVAEHTFHMTMLCRWLAHRHAWTGTTHFREELLMAALEHDGEEAMTGDRPSTDKMHSEPKGQIQITLKLADKLEALIFLKEEEMMGNRRVTDIRLEIQRKFMELWHEFDWDPNSGSKPIASDIIRQAEALCVFGHPALDPDVYRG